MRAGFEVVGKRVLKPAVDIGDSDKARFSLPCGDLHQPTIIKNSWNGARKGDCIMVAIEGEGRKRPWAAWTKWTGPGGPLSKNKKKLLVRTWQDPHDEQCIELKTLGYCHDVYINMVKCYVRNITMSTQEISAVAGFVN